jgi:hypothetical protein
VAEKFASDLFKSYRWSPSREAALCVRPGGRVFWDTNAPAKTVTTFGISGTVTVWTVERRCFSGDKNMRNNRLFTRVIRGGAAA